MFELPPEAQALLDPVVKNFESADRRHKGYRDRWAGYYRRYRSHQDFRSQYQAASPPDRDVALREAKREWGADLRIPYAFETVEQILPRAVSNRPRLMILPRGDTDEEKVQNMRMLVEAQQEQIRYELSLQDTAKSGFINGLGVSKVMWRTEFRQGEKFLERGVRQPWVQGTRNRTVFDDPEVHNVDIFDFFWDPYATELRRGRCRWALHRTWPSTEYVIEMLRSMRWNNPGGLEFEEVENYGPTGEYDTVHRDRMEAAGHVAFDSRNDHLHELWEYHDGDKVTLVLDRQFPVHVEDNILWHGGLPFHAYRPTTSGIAELPGIGEIEPIEHLLAELDTLRGQRRDNATITLQRPYAYNDGFIDPDDLKFGPGMAIPVNGDPRELLFPLPVQDIPGSSYQEEAALKADIERTTGLSDPVSGVGTGDQTATGVQLAQQAASVRIQLKTIRLDAEVAAPTADQFVSLNQQKITSARTVAVPEPGSRGEKWKQVKLGPEELAGDMFVVGAGGLAPDSVPQDRQDLQVAFQVFGQNQDVDQRELTRYELRKLGIKNPDAYMAPDTRIPPEFLQVLQEQFGAPPEMLQQALEYSQQLADAARTGESPPPPPDQGAEAAQNGQNGAPPTQRSKVG